MEFKFQTELPFGAKKFPHRARSCALKLRSIKNKNKNQTNKNNNNNNKKQQQQKRKKKKKEKKTYMCGKRSTCSESNNFVCYSVQSESAVIKANKTFETQFVLELFEGIDGRYNMISRRLY